MSRITPVAFATLIVTAASYAACADEADPFLSSDSPRGHWLTDDGALVIEMTSCEPGGETLCGVVRALPGAAADAELSAHAGELCGEALLGAFAYDARRRRWTGGEIVDPETEAAYQATIWVEDGVLKVLAFEGVELNGLTMDWARAAPSAAGCEAFAP